MKEIYVIAISAMVALGNSVQSQAGECQCIGEAAENAAFWSKTVSNADFYVENDNEVYFERIQINIKDGVGGKICGTVPIAVYNNGSCAFQQAAKFENVFCKPEGVQLPESYSNASGGSAYPIDRLDNGLFNKCANEFKAAYGIKGLFVKTTNFGGVIFPEGAVSFADVVKEYTPNKNGGPVPDVTQQDSRQALGTPGQGAVSLGNGGQIVVKFHDNKLAASGDDTPDLYIFEAGIPETTNVEIRRHLGPWKSVGTATGNAYGIDIDSYGVGPGEWYEEVRITDDGDSVGDELTTGADIDAVGARTSTWFQAGSRLDSESVIGLRYYIQAQVGGKSELIIEGSNLTWRHIKGTPPGLTIVDSTRGPNIVWQPDGWPEPLADGAYPEAYATFDSLSPVFPRWDWCWTVKKRSGIGSVVTQKQPSGRNRFALRVLFNDLGSGDKEHLSGSGMYSIELYTRRTTCD